MSLSLRSSINVATIIKARGDGDSFERENKRAAVYTVAIAFFFFFLRSLYLSTANALSIFRIDFGEFAVYQCALSQGSHILSSTRDLPRSNVQKRRIPDSLENVKGASENFCVCYELRCKANCNLARAQDTITRLLT